MAALELTKEQHDKLIEEFCAAGLNRTFGDSGESFLEKIVNEENYENDEFTHEDPVTGVKVIARIKGHRLKTVKFVAAREREIQRINSANARLWVYFN